MNNFYDKYYIFFWWLGIVAGSWIFAFFYNYLKKYLVNESVYIKRVKKYRQMKEEAIKQNDVYLVKDCEWQLLWLQNIEDYYFKQYFNEEARYKARAYVDDSMIDKLVKKKTEKN